MEQKIFHHFSEVICVDTVSHTNNDKRPLLTISGRDSYQKMFIVLRAFYQMKKLGFSGGIFNCNANIVPIIYLIKSENNYNWWLFPRIYEDWYFQRKCFQKCITYQIWLSPCKNGSDPSYYEETLFSCFHKIFLWQSM